MKIFVLACLVVASASAAFISSGSVERQRRDVSELSYNYLPPALKFATEEPLAETTTIAEELTEAPISASLGENGYEYRTVRRLKYRYRNRRDVSHLAQHYLPPSNDYLPPTEDDSETIQSAAPKVANEYLPPQQPAEEQQIASTEAPAADSEAPIAAAEPTAEEEVPQDTAILTKDGYHYKQPVAAVEQEVQQEEQAPQAEQEATLKANDDKANEYLPPLEDAAVVVEEVDPEESAILAKDGYHYRAVKRFRF